MQKPARRGLLQGMDRGREGRRRNQNSFLGNCMLRTRLK
jgi:hypothetical protein